MQYVHREAGPTVDPSAYVAPTAVLCGDVRVGPRCAIQFGAVLSAEDGSITLGRECVVMPNALVLTNRHAPVAIGDHVLIGPRTLSQWLHDRGRRLPPNGFLRFQ